MSSIHRFRFVPVHSLYGALLLLLPSTAVAQSPSPTQEPQLDEKALARLLYEGQNDPDFEGEVRFLRGVPLISRAPNMRSESQYYTSLILHARHMTEGMLYAEIRQLFTVALSQDKVVPKPSGRLRMQASNRALNRIFGKEDSLANAWVQKPIPNSVEDRHGHPHPHDHGQPEPMRVGFSASRLDVTTGLQTLLKVDSYMENTSDKKAALIGALGTDGVNWRIYDNETVGREHYERFISRFVPFVAHRDEGNLLVCGYCTYEGVSYLMGFDVTAIERRVSLGSSAGMPYSKYLQVKKERLARNPNDILDPLFWDYTSFFSRKNLDCFRLTPARETENVTALYPIGFDKEKVVTIIRDELEKAKAEQAKITTERLKRQSTRDGRENAN
jgi:hypothetical protein